MYYCLFACSFLLLSRYQTLRRDGRERKVVMATPRQLESFIRIAESLARMRLDERIRAADVAEAVRLWYGAMAGSAGSGSSDGRCGRRMGVDVGGVAWVRERGTP